MRLPRNPALALPGTTSRFEDLQAAHQLQSYRVHNVGAFLPFHRALLSAHETALRKECGYKGAQPYWAEEPDAGDFLGSTTYRDFGGDGDEGGCVNKGPFANVTNHLGPGYGYTNHCINRARDESFSTLSSQVYVDECLAKKTWLAHWNCTENNPHLGGHGGVGGLVRLNFNNSIYSKGKQRLMIRRWSILYLHQETPYSTCTTHGSTKYGQIGRKKTPQSA